MGGVRTQDFFHGKWAEHLKIKESCCDIFWQVWYLTVSILRGSAAGRV